MLIAIFQLCKLKSHSHWHYFEHYHG